MVKIQKIFIKPRGFSCFEKSPRSGIQEFIGEFLQTREQFNKLA